MRKILALFVFILAISCQNNKTGLKLFTISPVQLSAYGSTVNLDTALLQRLYLNRPDTINLEGLGAGTWIKLDMEQPVVTTQDGPVQFDVGVHYGISDGLGVLSVYKDDAHLQYRDDAGKSLSIQKVEAAYILAEEEHQGFECGTLAPEEGIEMVIDTNAAYLQGNKCVNLYIEARKDILDAKGSVQAAAEFITSAFAAVKQIYENDQIFVKLSEIKVWTIADPYGTGTTSDILNKFSSTVTGGYNGDFAMLLSAPPTGARGGIAWLDRMDKSYRNSYCEISMQHAAFPNYSWTVEVIAHEWGHNLGSPHTHSCNWPGGPIDGCANKVSSAYAEGNCNAGPIPVKGTIMSYCHILGGVGIDFKLGFGTLPSSLIRSRIASATTLKECGIVTPTCNDGIKNGSETGIDCGGTCPPCKINPPADSTSYCIPAKPNTTVSHITRLAIGNVTVSSGNDGGYIHFKNPITVTAGSTIVTYVSQSQRGASVPMVMRLYADFGVPGQLVPVGPRALSVGTALIRVTVPANSRKYVRLRVILSSRDGSDPCVVSGGVGDVEDYTLSVEGAVPPTDPCASNPVPVVRIASPLAGQEVTEPVKLVVNTDPDVIKVEISNGSVLLTTLTSRPFEFVIPNSIGYNLKVKVYDACTSSETFLQSIRVWK